jgi:hypothetical protein
MAKRASQKEELCRVCYDAAYHDEHLQNALFTK